jgi:hypothetical protein
MHQVYDYAKQAIARACGGAMPAFAGGVRL